MISFDFEALKFEPLARTKGMREVRNYLTARPGSPGAPRGFLLTHDLEQHGDGKLSCTQQLIQSFQKCTSLENSNSLSGKVTQKAKMRR